MCELVCKVWRVRLDLQRVQRDGARPCDDLAPKWALDTMGGHSHLPALLLSLSLFSSLPYLTLMFSQKQLA